MLENTKVILKFSKFVGLFAYCLTFSKMLYTSFFLFQNEVEKGICRNYRRIIFNMFNNITK